jgi:hypothetical protein
MKGNPGALSPEVKGLAGKFGAVIHGDGLWEVTAESQSLQEGNDGGPADGGINIDGQTLTGKVIDEGQAAEAAASKLIVDEVHGPALIGSSGHKQGNASQSREFTTQEVSEVLCFRVGLFFSGWLRFCQGAVAPSSSPEPRGYGGA